MRRLLSLATLYPNAHSPRFGTFVARSLESLAARGDWLVTVINPIGLPPLLYGHYRELALAATNGETNRVEIYRPTFRLLPGLSGNWNARLIARKILPLARHLHQAAPFDLVDAQFFYPDGPAAARIAADLGVPLAIKARGADISYWGGRRSPLRQMRKATRRADRLLAVSDALANDMEALGFAAEKVRVHYTGLDRDLFRPLDRFECRVRLAEHFGFALPPGAALLACVGALIPRKGQAFAIEALPALPEAHLLLVGKGPDEARLRALARRLGVAARVHFLGSLDHTLLPVLLSASDAMVLPSASEGLANAWVEAVACGCPLVTTDVGGARELVRSEAAGTIVARDAGAIASALEALLAHPPDRDAVAATAERFSWPAHAEALAGLYEDIVETP